MAIGAASGILGLGIAAREVGRTRRACIRRSASPDGLAEDLGHQGGIADQARLALCGSGAKADIPDALDLVALAAVGAST